VRRVLVLGLTLVCLAMPEAGLAWSWPVDGAVLRGFTVGADPYAAGQHRGIDIAATKGDPVRAPATGEVTFAGFVPARGKSVSILTASGFSVTLSHLGELLVTKGQVIDEGAMVGKAGTSGSSDHPTPYVQLGIRDASDPNGYRDPLGFLPVRTTASPPPETTVAVAADPAAATASAASGSEGPIVAPPDPVTAGPPVDPVTADPVPVDPVPVDPAPSAADAEQPDAPTSAPEPGAVVATEPLPARGVNAVEPASVGTEPSPVDEAGVQPLAGDSNAAGRTGPATVELDQAHPSVRGHVLVKGHLVAKRWPAGSRGLRPVSGSAQRRRAKRRSVNARRPTRWGLRLERETPSSGRSLAHSRSSTLEIAPCPPTCPPTCAAPQ